MNKRTYIRQYYPLGLLSALMLAYAVMGCIPAVQIMVEQRLMDAAIAGMSGNALQRFLLAIGQFIALMLLNSLLAAGCRHGTVRCTLTIARRLDQQRIAKCSQIAYPITETQTFHELYEQAEKASEANGAFFTAMETGTKTAIQLAASFAVLLSIDVRTAVVVAVLLALGICMSKNAAVNSGGIWEKYIQNMRHANYLSSLMLHREYAKERKLFHYNEEIEGRYHKNCTEAIEKNCALGRKRLFSECWATLSSAMYSMAAILLLIAPVQSGRISTGAFIAALTAISSLRSVAKQLYGAVFDFSSSFERLTGFFSFLALPEEKEAKATDTIDLSKGIEFQHVCFTYPSTSSAVLDDLCFTLKPGKHYALVGENGSGKTTLVKLLLGLYQPTSGRILVGGKDVSTMNAEEKRQLFSAVFQDFYRYPLSIRENASLASPAMKSADTIYSVLDALHFDAPICREENGLDISLGFLKQKSADLSGGEWQKLAVARVVLSPTPIAVLDEPNAALDPMSEMAFYHAYEEMLVSKTTLFISHRLGAVKSADQILVLKNHHLIAMNSHDALMTSCAYYRELFETQRGLYDEAK